MLYNLYFSVISRIEALEASFRLLHVMWCDVMWWFDTRNTPLVTALYALFAELNGKKCFIRCNDMLFFE